MGNARNRCGREFVVDHPPGESMSSTARSITDAWDQYLSWNQAVCDVIYPVSEDAIPVYLDMEPDELRQIAEHAGSTSGEPRDALADAVRAVTINDSGSFDLGPLVRNTRLWSKQKADAPPPCLAFLAVTALAAEDMGTADADIAKHAYYARLARLLKVPENDQRVRHEYPHYAETLWRTLNSWLEDQDGERGIPTAYALTHRYVGLPMSQALVREADRQKLPVMFAQFGLSPGMQIAPEDLITYLDNWLNSEHSPASVYLQRLWGRQATRERIATVVAVELANWDGAIEDGSALTAGGTTLATRAVVVANLRSGFLDSSLDLSLALRPLRGDMNGQMQVLSASESWIDIGFSPGTAGLWRTSYSEAIDFGSMLEGAIRIRHAQGDQALEYKRFPRTVIPLVYDELQSAFVETERLQIGVDSLLLVRTVAQTKVKTNVVEEVERALSASARPGYERVDDLEGLPPGWALFKDVQLFGAPPTDRLNELIPLARNKLTIAGGLRIPSKIRKWSSLSPPEIRAAVQSEADLRVTLVESASDEVLREWTSCNGVLVAPLATANLQDGDYHVSLFTGTNKNPVQQSSIRLRSSRTTDVLWASAPRLVYALDDPCGTLSASSNDEPAETLVDGLHTEGDCEVEAVVRATGKVTWAGLKPPNKPNKIQIGTPDPTSCIVTGAHHLILPTFWGKSTTKFIDGECKSCGLVKRFPSWPGNRWNSRKSAATEVPIVVHDLEEIDEQARPDWDVALDSLMHLGGGTFSSLESIALQLEGSSLFVDKFVRTLEALAHIGVERDNEFKPVRWEISPSCLAEVADGPYRLAGFWPQEFVGEVADIATQYGGALSADSSSDGPSTRTIPAIDDSQASDIGQVNPDITIVDQTGLRMLRALPCLSSVGHSLKRVPMPGFQSAERFDESSASWVPTGDPYVVGAFRLRRGFETIYIFRSAEDIESGTAAAAPVHLVKHLAANAVGDTLVSYQKKISTILLPQGSDLPGLYGRAVVALAGRLPLTKKISLKDGPKRRCLVYEQVDRDSADLLATLLTT
jgi:hypothetical protein